MDVLQGAPRYSHNAPPAGGGHLTTQHSLHQVGVLFDQLIGGELRVNIE